MAATSVLIIAGLAVPSTAAFAVLDESRTAVLDVRDSFTAHYGEGVLVPVKVLPPRGGEEEGLRGKLVWSLVSGGKTTTVATTTVPDDGGLILPPKLIRRDVPVGSSHKIKVTYTPDNGETLTTLSKLTITKVTPQITVSLTKKLVSRELVKKNGVGLFAMIKANGVSVKDLKGTARVKINGKYVGKKHTVTMNTIPGSSTQKPSIKINLDKKKISKKRTYKISVVFTPSSSFSKIATKATSSTRTLVVE